MSQAALKSFDLTILTQKEYLAPKEITPYIANVLKEDQLLQEALEAKGLNVTRINWDNPDFDWTQTKAAVIRATWDYFHRVNEFSQWLDKVSGLTQLIHHADTVRWNMDKHYLADLQAKGIAIVPTLFVEQGDTRNLGDVISSSEWDKVVLKPAISGAARHTYVINLNNVADHENIFRRLIAEEAMMIQPFLENIISKGEVSHMLFGGQYSHSILKMAKPGDFRVQDDFGGTIYRYQPTLDEIDFAQQAVASCVPKPVYARVDVVWDNDDNLALAELELIEPELWLRKKPEAAEQFTNALLAAL